MSPNETPADLESTAYLLDRLAIADVMARYCRGIDRFDEALVRSCFTADATDQHGSFNGTIDEFIAWAFRLLQKYESTMHLIANHLADVVGENAVAETYGIAFHRSDDPDPKRNLTVGFRYIDRLVKVNGEWKISERVATTEWVQAKVAESHWPIPGNSAVGHRSHDDALFRFLEQLPKQ